MCMVPFAEGYVQGIWARLKSRTSFVVLAFTQFLASTEVVAWRERTMSQAQSQSVFSGSISDLKAKVAPPPPVVQFCRDQEPHWMFVFTLSHLLFWMRGIPSGDLDKGRFYNDNKFNHDGGIPSGPMGSGVFPISLILTVVVTVTVAAKAVVFKPAV